MQQVFRVAATFAVALLLGAALAWHPAGFNSQAGASAAASLSAAPAVRVFPRCGGERTRDRAVAGPALPNAYMTVNGRLFALADVLACASRLHSVRFA